MKQTIEIKIVPFFLKVLPILNNSINLLIPAAKTNTEIQDCYKILLRQEKKT